LKRHQSSKKWLFSQLNDRINARPFPKNIAPKKVIHHLYARGRLQGVNDFFGFMAAKNLIFGIQGTQYSFIFSVAALVPLS